MAQCGIANQKRMCVVAGVKRMGQFAQSGGHRLRRQLDRRGLDPSGKFQQFGRRDLLVFLIQPGRVSQPPCRLPVKPGSVAWPNTLQIHIRA